MRVDANERNPDWPAYSCPGPWIIYLDGELLGMVVKADTEQGLVTQYREPFTVEALDRHGDVEIYRSDCLEQ